MDGFITRAEKGRKGCATGTNPIYTNARNLDAMGYHDARELPNNWSCAEYGVLQGSHVRASCFMEPARSPFPGPGLISSLPAGASRCANNRA